MLTILYSEGGRTEPRLSVDLKWLAPDSPGVLWVDLASPTPEEATILRTVFGFHELAIEDALSRPITRDERRRPGTDPPRSTSGRHHRFARMTRLLSRGRAI